MSVPHPSVFFSFFFNDTATTEIYTLSLHDALPICAVPGSIPQVSHQHADVSRMEDVFVEYLTDIEVAPGEQPRLYRAFVTRNGLSFERFTESAWVQDPMLPECLEAMGLVHVTPEHAGSTAADIT